MNKDDIGCYINEVGYIVYANIKSKWDLILFVFGPFEKTGWALQMPNIQSTRV